MPIELENGKCLQILLTDIRSLLTDNGIQGRVQGRIKSLQAIYYKMIRTEKSFEEILDRVGLRVIVNSVCECYAVLGLIHTHFEPIQGTFDDYIGLPKKNGYQSLHTCVYPARKIPHQPIEIQVRTEQMHMKAEHGTAAHWRYKHESTFMNKSHNCSRWMKNLSNQHEEAKINGNFLKLLHRQAVLDQILRDGDSVNIMLNYDLDDARLITANKGVQPDFNTRFQFIIKDLLNDKAHNAPLSRSRSK